MSSTFNSLDDVVDADRRWFESHQTLSHRVRWTASAEVLEAVTRAGFAPPRGACATHVTQLRPGVRVRRLLGGYHEPRLYAGQVALVGHESTFAYLDEVLGLGTPTTVRYALDDAGLVALLYRLPEEVAASPVEVKGCVAYVGTGHVVTDPDPVFLPGVWLPTTGGTWAPRRVDS